VDDADDRPDHLHHPDALHAQEEPASTLRNVELPPARWATVHSPLSATEVRRRISEGLSTAAAGFSLSETRHGFIVRWTRGKNVLIAEVALTGWEEGTQVHLSVPKDCGATENDVQVLRERLLGAVAR
jgi:hypothetical protein